MGGYSQRLFWGRAAGLLVILIMHAAILIGLSTYQVSSTPQVMAPIFGYLIDPPPVPPQVAPPQPPQPVAREKPRPLQRVKRQRIVAEAPVRLPAEPVASPPPAPAAAVDAVPAPPVRPAEPLTLGNELAVSCPERTPPAYPTLSMRLREEGRVVLRVNLNEQGRVSDASIVSSSGSDRLDEAALATVRTWRCTPAQRGGRPVPAVATQPFNFVLGER